MTHADLDMVRRWRNSPSVNAVMRTRHAIEPEEHRQWFERSVADASRRLWIFESPLGPNGFVQFQDVIPGRRTHWGFYAAPNAPKGTGRSMCAAALSRIFDESGVAAVEAEVMEDNLRSIALHEVLGFTRQGSSPSSHRSAEGRPLSIWLFALESGVWSVQRSRLGHHRH
jgi:UDP-4-amino-4,6-dideoxy-N-acetyl-beta-L-altrosamine N-acetyltransferase